VLPETVVLIETGRRYAFVCLRTLCFLFRCTLFALNIGVCMYWTVAYTSFSAQSCCHGVPCRLTVEPTNLLQTLPEQNTTSRRIYICPQPNETESQGKLRDGHTCYCVACIASSTCAAVW
jgi:hypothetical protein